MNPPSASSIALADKIRENRPAFSVQAIALLGDYCASVDSAFDRNAWLNRILAASPAPESRDTTPWTVELIETANGPAYSILGRENVEIADVSPDWPDGGLEHARWIAAAPELISALKNAANVLAALATGQLKEVKKDSVALGHARAAIAKAEGRA